MVETINASVFKASVDTKVGISVEEKGGKVFVSDLTGLFGATDLRNGDELVTVNGKLVEGMNSSEVVGIIKEAKGDVTIVAKRGGAVVAKAVGSDSPPGKCPPGGTWGTVKYVGPETKRNACIACLCCGPLGLCILACPGDEQDAYCVNGKVYNAAGYFICKQDDKFTPARPRS